MTPLERSGYILMERIFPPISKGFCLFSSNNFLIHLLNISLTFRLRRSSCWCITTRAGRSDIRVGNLWCNNRVSLTVVVSVEMNLLSSFDRFSFFFLLAATKIKFFIINNAVTCYVRNCHRLMKVVLRPVQALLIVRT